MKFIQLETQENKKETYDVFNLTKEQINELKEKVRASEGTIRIFIHPYFSESIGKMPQTDIQPLDHEAVYNTMIAGFNKILISDSKKVPPLFVFEEFNKAEKAKLKIKDITKNTVYFVPTSIGYPAPRIPDTMLDDLYEKKGYNQDGWEYISELFKKIGVKSILIAGRNFTITQHDTGKDFALNSCIGNTFNSLQTEFDVKMSNLTYPNRKNDLN